MKFSRSQLGAKVFAFNDIFTLLRLPLDTPHGGIELDCIVTATYGMYQARANDP
jgi:hypothetical protein